MAFRTARSARAAFAAVIPTRQMRSASALRTLPRNGNGGNWNGTASQYLASSTLEDQHPMERKARTYNRFRNLHCQSDPPIQASMYTTSSVPSMFLKFFLFVSSFRYL